MAYKTDPYADIDFEDINDVTGLANDEIKCLKVNLLTTNTPPLLQTL